MDTEEALDELERVMDKTAEKVKDRAQAEMLMTRLEIMDKRIDIVVRQLEVLSHQIQQIINGGLQQPSYGDSTSGTFVVNQHGSQRWKP